MLITARDATGPKTRIIDFTGKVIPFVKSFDTVTKEAELMFVTSRGNGEKAAQLLVVADDAPGAGAHDAKVLVVKVLLPGCKAINRETGEEIL